jgi:hypothetical protein
MFLFIFIVVLLHFSSLHSLTGPVVQPFAFHLGGQRFASVGYTHSHNGTRFLMLALSCCIGDPDVNDHWPRRRLHAVDGKFQ